MSFSVSDYANFVPPPPPPSQFKKDWDKKVLFKESFDHPSLEQDHLEIERDNKACSPYCFWIQSSNTYLSTPLPPHQKQPQNDQIVHLYRLQNQELIKMDDQTIQFLEF